MIEQSIKQPKRSKCCNALIGFDGWVDSNDEICGGPFDTNVCLECGIEDPDEADPEPDDSEDGGDSTDSSIGGPKAPDVTDMLAHTPGPWHVEMTDTKGESIYITAQNNYAVAKVDTEANARLIVAAPDLLAALEKIESLARAAEILDSIDWYDALEDIGELSRAAIAKVTEGRVS